MRSLLAVSAIILTLAACAPVPAREIDPFPDQTDAEFMAQEFSLIAQQECSNTISELKMEVEVLEAVADALAKEINGEWGSFNQN